MKRDGKTVEAFRISDSGADLVETALRNMGFNPDDKDMPTPDMTEFTKAVNAELAKRTIRK